MHLSDDARRALRCPRCADGAIEDGGGTLVCGACGAQFPLVGEIPCLVPDPSLWRELWLSRLHDYASATETRAHHLLAEADLPDLLPRTRARVLRVLQGLHEQRAGIERILEALKDGTRAAPAAAIPSRPESRDKLAVLECYENLFRDWAWGGKESAIMAALVQKMAPVPIDRLAVYGAGAGRLAVDVHQSLKPILTFALDVNPLPLLVADALVSGQGVDLPEFPVAPHADDQTVITRKLRYPFQVRAGLTFLFADAFAPPFAPGSVDAVLTPWFIDATPTDFRATAAVINRVLRPGGHFINLGPLRFENALSRVYSVEEVHDIVAASGFDLVTRLREDVPYFDSPASGSRRTETLIGFVARKSAEAQPVTIPSLVPAWVVDPRLPVPQSPVIMNLGRTSMFTASAVALIDGVRSIADIAAALGGPWALDPALIADQLRAFFAKLPPK